MGLKKSNRMPPVYHKKVWWAGQDLNLQPIGYEPTALTD